VSHGQDYNFLRAQLAQATDEVGAVGRKTVGDGVRFNAWKVSLEGSMTNDEVQTLLDGSETALIGVYPVLRVRVLTLITNLTNEELPFAAFMGIRTFTQQDVLWAQGRTTPGKIVTNAKGGESWHQFGLAVDLVEDGDISRTGIQWSWSDNAAYLKIGTAARLIGLEWGGWWKAFVDYPHVQLVAGLSLAEANKIYADAGNSLEMVWAEVDRRLAA